MRHFLKGFLSDWNHRWIFLFLKIDIIIRYSSAAQYQCTNLVRARETCCQATRSSNTHNMIIHDGGLIYIYHISFHPVNMGRTPLWMCDMQPPSKSCGIRHSPRESIDLPNTIWVLISAMSTCEFLNELLYLTCFLSGNFFESTTAKRLPVLRNIVFPFTSISRSISIYYLLLL